MASMLDSFKAGKVPKPTDITRKIEVIGAGLGRTGTMSFSAALEKLLHGPIYHSGNMLISDEESTAKTWSQILDPDADPEFVNYSLRALLAGYVSVTDTWGAAFTPELLGLYPDAVVICTLREPEAWWRSWIGIPINAVSSWHLEVLKFFLWPVPVLRYSPAAQKNVWRRFPKHYGVPPGLPNSKDYIQYHIDWLKRIVPPERLHFFNVKDGWEPLCKILNVPIPDEPFPRINEKAAMKELNEAMMKVVYGRWGMIMGGTFVAVIGVLLSRKGFLQ
ncbi:hypothetical protein N431DRAFT_551022 [Stipitochalara longipes BDJ]|nr:hypothetical protein N431DRAFT_551022 [Stipitochalara longipes BDJ]